MTTSIAGEVERRRGSGGRPRTPFGALARVAERVTRRAEATAWPSAKYARAPELFSREVLGAKPYDRQIEIAEAVRDHGRVAVASGHKVGKSYVAAWLALWFYCSFPAARVVMSSTTSRQVDQILWRELRMFHARAREPIGGDMHELARSGLKASDFREIVGFTAREAEAVAGISGPNLLYILDEASGIPDVIFEAIEGNRAGGARIVMFSNPTRTDGEFFEAFHAKAEFYRTFQLSSEETPNAREGRVVVPGLATREWIEEKRREWGEDSPLFKIRVKGEFCLNEDGKILSVDAIGQAEARWHDTPAEGRLQIGLDPAGEGMGGDETALAVRRGLKVLSVLAVRGKSAAEIVVWLEGAMREHRVERDRPPIVVVDSEGKIGGEVLGRLRAHAARVESDPDRAFEVVGVRASDRGSRGSATRRDYDRVRDELWGNLADWIKSEGGAIPEDVRLAKELHAPEWIEVFGRQKVTPKDVIKRDIGRSPDRADAVALAVWPVRRFDAEDPDERAIAKARLPSEETDHDDADDVYDDGPINPYEGV